MHADLRSILVATDLGPGSDRTVRAAGVLARATGATLHAVHAFDLDPLPLGVGGEGAAPPTFQGRLDAATRAVDEQVARCVGEGVEVGSRHVVIWSAHKAILERAADVSADVLVLGPNRGEGIGDLLGGTADRVLREAAAPCLVVRGEGLALPLERVAVGTDLSESAGEALEVAGDWAAALGAPDVEVRAVYVAPELLDTDDEVFDRVVAERSLEEAVTEAVRGSGVSARAEVVWGGGPAEALARYAREEGVGLLVLGTHGRGAVARALLGSVASGVARRAPCPVLLVPPKVWRAER